MLLKVAPVNTLNPYTSLEELNHGAFFPHSYLDAYDLPCALKLSFNLPVQLGAPPVLYNLPT